MDYKIYSIIVNYNSAVWIKKTIESIKNSSYPLKTIVVDNNSTDKSLDWIENNYQEIYIVKSKRNLGFGKANNIGIKYALDQGADYVFLQNQDLYLEVNCIHNLLKVAINNQDFALYSPLHLNGNGSSLDYWFSIYSSPPKCKGYVSELALGKSLKPIYETSMVNAAAWLIPKRTLKRIGGFHPSFFHYGEDSNYCDRLNYFGMKIGIVPNAKAYHDRAQRERSKFETDEIEILERNLIKNFSFPNRPKAKFFLSLKYLVAIFKAFRNLHKVEICRNLNFLYKIIRFDNKSIEEVNLEFAENSYCYINK